jgi:hypothetical protein
MNNSNIAYTQQDRRANAKREQTHARRKSNRTLLCAAAAAVRFPFDGCCTSSKAMLSLWNKQVFNIQKKKRKEEANSLVFTL